MGATLDIDKEILKRFCVKQIKQTNPQMCLFSPVKHEEALFQYKGSVAQAAVMAICVSQIAHI